MFKSNLVIGEEMFKKLLLALAFPFAWLFSWLRMKWAWRGFATITKQDWQKAGDKKKLLRALRKDQSVKDAQAALTKALWPEAHTSRPHESEKEPMSLEEMQEEMQEAMRDMLRKHNISYEDFMAYKSQEGGTGFSFKIRRSGDGGNS